MISEPTRDISQILAESNAFLDAAREAADDTIQLHKKMGLPMAVWKDGRPAWVVPEELEQASEESFKLTD